MSTLRNAYLPGVGRKTSSIGLNYGSSTFVAGRGRGRGRGLFIPGLRGRGFFNIKTILKIMEFEEGAVAEEGVLFVFMGRPDPNPNIWTSVVKSTSENCWKLRRRMPHDWPWFAHIIFL